MAPFLSSIRRWTTAEPIPTLEFLHSVSSRIAAADPLHEVLDQIVEFVSEFVSCDSCFIYVLEGNALVLRASKNPHPEVVDNLRVPLGEGITGWVAEHREPVVIERDAAQDPRFRAFDELPEDSYHSFLSIPVISRRRVVSVINVQHQGAVRQFTPREKSSRSRPSGIWSGRRSNSHVWRMRSRNSRTSWQCARSSNARKESSRRSSGSVKKKRTASSRSRPAAAAKP